MLRDRFHVSRVSQLHVGDHSKATPHRQIKQDQPRDARIEIMALCEDGRIGLDEEVNTPIDKAHVRRYGDEHGFAEEDDEGLEEDLFRSFAKGHLDQVDGSDVASVSASGVEAFGFLAKEDRLVRLGKGENDQREADATLKRAFSFDRCVQIRGGNECTDKVKIQKSHLQGT